MKNFKKIYSTILTAVVISTSLFSASCNKDSGIGSLELNQATAKVDFTVQGNWGNPFKPAEWPKVYIDLAKQQYGDLPHNAQVLLESRVNSNIAAAEGYTLRRIAKDIDQVTKDDWSTEEAINVTSVGNQTSDTPLGWYTYDKKSHANVAVPNVTILVGKGEVAWYAIKLISFTGVEQKGFIPGPWGNLRVRGKINLQFKAL